MMREDVDQNHAVTAASRPIVPATDFAAPTAALPVPLVLGSSGGGRAASWSWD